MRFRNLAIIMFSLVLGITILYAGVLIYLNWPIKSTSISKTGLFGDSFGVINTIFSGLAFAGLILTLHAQRQELNESKISFRKERFEDTFFRLLEFYRHNLDNIRISDYRTKEIYIGVGALNFLIKKFNEALQPFGPYLNKGIDGKDMYCFKLFGEAQNILGRQTRYLGTLECLLNLVDKSDFTNEDKNNYYDIISSQLTAFELQYLFYTCMTAPKDDRLRPLVHRSNLFSHPIIESTINKHHLMFYSDIHEFALNYKRRKKFFPFGQKDLKRIRKNIRKASKEARLSASLV